MARISGPSLEQLDHRGDAFSAVMKTAMVAVLDDVIPNVDSVDDLNMIRTRWNDIAEVSLQSHLWNAWASSAEDTYDQLVKVSQRMDRERQGALLSALFIPKVVSRLAELFLASAINRLFSIGELVWNVARTQMVQGMQAGESISEIRVRLLEVANIASPRAEVIARTEIVGASNAGSFAEMKASGLPAQKEWIATEDKRTRESHHHVDGQWKDIDEKFIVGGYAMAYPHDPAGPPEEVINCRCTLGWDIPDEEFVEDEDDMVASGTQTFHLPGRHDQKDHGRKGLRGLKAGKPLKITHGLVHKKHADGSIVAVTKDGKKHILWEANKYHLREKDDKGLWQTKSTAIKSKAYKEINAFAPDWHEPDNDEKDDKKADEKSDVTPTPTTTPDEKPDVKSSTKVDDKKTTITSVPANEVATPGDKVDVNEAFLDANVPNNSTIAMQSGGKLRMVKKDGNIEIQRLDNGFWEVDDKERLYDAMSMIDTYPSDWHAPVGKGSTNATAPPLPKVKTVTASKVKTGKPVSKTTPISADDEPLPGTPLKVTHGMIHSKHPEKSTIAVSSDGNKKVNWDGQKYEFYEKNSDGSWQLKDAALKSASYKKMNEFGDDWTVPEKASTKNVIDTSTPSTNDNAGVPSSSALDSSSFIPASDAHVAPGDKIDITNDIGTQKYPPGQFTIAVSNDGDGRLVRNASGTFSYQTKMLAGNWTTFTIMQADDPALATKINGFASSWHKPTPDVKAAGASKPFIGVDDAVVPGFPATLDADFLGQNFKDNSVVAVSGDGKVKIVKNGDGFEAHELISGNWEHVADGQSVDDVEPMIDEYDQTWHSPMLVAEDFNAPAVKPAVPAPVSVTPTDEDIAPGKYVTLDQAYIDQDFPSQAVIGVTDDSNYKVVIDGPVVRVMVKGSKGEWKTKAMAKRADAGAMIKKQGIVWHQPLDDSTPPTASSPSPSPSSSPTSLPSAPKPPEAPPFVYSKNVRSYEPAEPDKPVTDMAALVSVSASDSIPAIVLAMTKDGKTRLSKSGNVIFVQTKKGKYGWVDGPYINKSDAAGHLATIASDWHTVKRTMPASNKLPTLNPDGTKNYTQSQINFTQAVFGSSETKKSSSAKNIYNAALQVSQKDPTLTMADALAIMDKEESKKAKAPVTPFKTKTSVFLGTPSGAKYAKTMGGSAPAGETVQLVKPTGPPPPAPTNSGAYKVMTKSSSTTMQNEMDATWPPPWTYEQRAALNHYTGSSYVTLNKCLRGTGDCSPSTLSYIKHIKAAMKPSTRDIMLYRKTNLATFGVSTVEELEKLAGTTIKDKGIVSTSITEAVWSGKVHMKIETPTGSNIAWVSPLSQFKGENEFVVAPGTDFEVLSVEPHWSNPSERIMRVRIVPGSGDLT